MCTVSWFHAAGGYQLFCNRDEKRTRKQAFEPRVFEQKGVRFAAPRDGAAGGAWIAVNEFGLSLCLLNGDGGAGRITRGQVVLELIASRSLSDLNDRLDVFHPAAYAPFTVLALTPDRRSSAVIWNGRHLERIEDAEHLMPLTSSSQDALAARAARREQMTRLLNGIGRPHAGAFLAFHRSHAPQPGPNSPCMHRADAETVSFTWVTVTPAEINLYYSPGPPCRSLAGSSQTLALQKEEQPSCLVYC